MMYLEVPGSSRYLIFSSSVPHTPMRMPKN